MQIRVVKGKYGKVSLLVVSQGTPPLPAVAVQALEPGDVKDRVSSVLADFKRARVSTNRGTSPSAD